MDIDALRHLVREAGSQYRVRIFCCVSPPLQLTSTDAAILWHVRRYDLRCGPKVWHYPAYP
jgi:hypothetical protein